ncbi:MAG: type II secretion system protein [Sedimentisphaerales bacterium]|nr:type II secretion system protein [Sedimentisphaerales bacterium]
MRKCSRAFTLIELTVVILIISLSLAIVLPKITRASDPQFLLKLSTNKIASVMEYAYQQAASKRLTYFFNINSNNGTYWISKQNKDGQELSIKEQLKLDGELPEGVEFLRIKLFGENVISQEKIAIRLSPDGYADPVEIVLTCSSGEMMSISIDEYSGKVRTNTLEVIN